MSSNIFNSSEANRLFSEYESIDDEVNKAEKQYKLAMEKRTQIVRTIKQKVGKGPFVFNHKYIGTVVDKGNTAYFRGRNNSSVTEIE